MIEVGSVVQIDQVFHKVVPSHLRGITFIVEDVKGKLVVLTGFKGGGSPLSFLNKDLYKTHRSIAESNIRSNYLITAHTSMLSVVGEKLQEVI